VTVLDAPPARAVVEIPGVYDDMPEDLYHLDPVPGGSLSSSGARKLLPPSCPAKFRYEMDHPTAPTAAMETGTAAHKQVLGAGAPVEVVDAKDWRTNAAKDAAAAIRARGGVPLLPADYLRVQEMALAIKTHPVAGILFDPGRGGLPERSLFWVDAEFGVWCRARLDWMPPVGGERFIIVDYKTTVAAEPDAIRKHVASYGYHVQAAFYDRGVRALGLHEKPDFLFVFQETTAPYLITVVQLDEDAMYEGERACREALERYRDCKEAGDWPGYTEEIQLVSLPPWARRRYGEEGA
jgi:PDDEXK-like domain of unknown function (DUF3799)